MAIFDDINNIFDYKLNSLDKIKKHLESLIGSEPPKGTTPLAMMVLVDNLRGLYELDKETYNVLLQFRKGIINLHKTDLKVEIRDLENRFNQIFGSLESTLKKINEDDDTKKRGDNPFYG